MYQVLLFKFGRHLCIGSITEETHGNIESVHFIQTNMTLKRVTCNSFPWNKAWDFRTPIICPNANKSKIEAAHSGKCAKYVTSIKTPALNQS